MITHQPRHQRGLNLIAMVYEQYRRCQRALTAPWDKHRNWRIQAKSLHLSKSARLRLEWIIYYETTAQRRVAVTCRHFGIVPKTWHKWRNRFDGKTLMLLEDHSTAPHATRSREITPREEERIVSLRKEHLRWGKMKIACLYTTAYGERLSSWKVQYTIKKYHLYYHPKKNAQTQAKRKRSHTKKRITELSKHPYAGHLIALDTIVLYWNGAKRYILTAIDTTTKVAFARMYTTKSSANAADFLQRMLFLVDHRAQNILTDNGSEFHKAFIVACARLGLTQYWSRNHTPTDNPVTERFNRTLKEEFIDMGNMTTDCEVFNRKLTEWLIEYTFVRPHQTLNYATPWEYYATLPTVLPMSSSRTSH